MSLVANSLSVTAAAKLFDGIYGPVTVSATVQAFIGGSNVTATGGGLPLAANTPAVLHLNGEAVYAAAASASVVGWIASQ